MFANIVKPLLRNPVDCYKPWEEMWIYEHGLYCRTTPTKVGHDAMFVCVDELSKMAHFMATTTTVTAKEMTRLF